ncbi:MAG: hypothetical protein ACK4N5_23390 [Myxococcales bacterium]
MAESRPAPPVPALEPVLPPAPAPLPVHTPPPAREAPVARLPVSEPIPKTVEEMFLRRAEEALGRGECGKFLTGLEELIDHPGAAGSAEKARILRARCYDERVQPVDADAEYRRYLREYPHGKFADEARRATAH